MTAKHLTSTKAGKALLSLLVLAVLAVTLQTVVFSDARFTAASSSASNVWTTGTLSHANSMADGVVRRRGRPAPRPEPDGDLDDHGRRRWLR